MSFFCWDCGREGVQCQNECDGCDLKMFFCKVCFKKRAKKENFSCGTCENE